MIHSPRIPVPSKAVLEERVDSTKHALESILLHSTCDLNRQNIFEVQDCIKQMKAACKLFEDASRSLSSWLSSHGHTQESVAVRRERHKLVYRY